ncbi:hypothetical protein ABIB48_002656 [Arthrobacter sp. UYCu511]
MKAQELAAAQVAAYLEGVRAALALATSNPNPTQ